MSAESRRAVAEALVDIGAVGFRPEAPVTFKSGIVSPIYCDNRRFPFWPAAWRKVIDGFAATIEKTGLACDVVGGVEAAGIPHSAALGFAMGKPSVFIRKEAKGHGTKKRVEGGDVAGKHVVLVEDLVTTGGSSLSGVEALRAEGATVRDCLVIISYGFVEAAEQFAAASITLRALTTFEDVLQVVETRGLLRGNEGAVVRRWLADPRGWAAQRGTEARQ